MAKAYIALRNMPIGYNKNMDQEAKKKQDQPAELGPIGSGIKLFFVDSGISNAFFVLAAIILLLVGYTPNDIANNRILDVIGLFISVYVAFLLYKNYSRQNKALIALIVTAIVATAVDICSQVLTHDTLHLTTQLLSLGTDLLAYCFGWYLAATTNFKIFLLSKKWTTVFFVIGIIALVIGYATAAANFHK